MVKASQDSKDFSRRKFLKGGALLGATASLAVVSGDKVTEQAVQAFGKKELDEFPVEQNSDFKRYDEKYTCFNRSAWDSSFEFSSYDEEVFMSVLNNKIGFYQPDMALQSGAWSVSGFGFSYGDPMFEWEGRVAPNKYVFESNEAASKAVKKAAKFYGADLVGICKYEDVKKWEYDPLFTYMDGSIPAKFPFEPKSVIVMAIEMDYDATKTSPTWIGDAATGRGYSNMATTSYSLATFMRQLGYKSFAAGNNVSLSVPTAIQAGLGELGRHGLLLTQEYGCRVRLVKVFTEMELAYDKPTEFGGMKFCEYCKRCAESCPSESIPYDTERNYNTITVSNQAGVKKWYVNVETCYDYWGKSATSCSCCIAACPYNKPNFWHHTLTSGLTSTPMKPFLKAMDELFGYGHTFDEQACLDFWDRD